MKYPEIVNTLSISALGLLIGSPQPEVNNEGNTNNNKNWHKNGDGNGDSSLFASLDQHLIFRFVCDAETRLPKVVTISFLTAM